MKYKLLFLLWSILFTSYIANNWIYLSQVTSPAITLPDWQAIENILPWRGIQNAKLRKMLDEARKKDETIKERAIAPKKEDKLPIQEEKEVQAKKVEDKVVTPPVATAPTPTTIVNMPATQPMTQPAIQPPYIASPSMQYYSPQPVASAPSPQQSNPLLTQALQGLFWWWNANQQSGGTPATAKVTMPAGMSAPKGGNSSPSWNSNSPKWGGSHDFSVNNSLPQVVTKSDEMCWTNDSSNAFQVQYYTDLAIKNAQSAVTFIQETQEERQTNMTEWEDNNLTYANSAVTQAQSYMDLAKNIIYVTENDACAIQYYDEGQQAVDVARQAVERAMDRVAVKKATGTDYIWEASSYLWDWCGTNMTKVCPPAVKLINNPVPEAQLSDGINTNSPTTPPAPVTEPINWCYEKDYIKTNDWYYCPPYFDIIETKIETV